MRILETGTEDAMKWLDRCAEAAKKSNCERARCGSVIVKEGELLSEGFNSPPRNDAALRTCLNEYEIPAGFRHDRTCCIHAEQRAIQNALKEGRDPKGGSIYFAAIDEKGDKIMATDMKCTICSRAVLDAGIKEFIFYSAEGIRVYDPAEVDRLSYEFRTPLKM
jgi:deoxycytidylate deaminase